MVQLILAVIIIALGFFVFKFYPIEKGNVKNLALSAIFIIITLICKRFFTIMVPLFGAESLKVGIEYIPLMVAGYLLAPSYAFLIGLCCDLIGLILVPTGFPFFGFTLVMILVCVIPSLIKIYASYFNENLVRHFVEILICILALGASLYIYTLENVTISQTVYEVTPTLKLILISVCLILMVLFIVLIKFLKNKISENESREFSTWILSVTLVEIICTLCLTPLWLDIMYGIPFVVSLCVRIIKECVILPLEIFVGYTLLKVIKRIQRV